MQAGRAGGMYRKGHVGRAVLKATLGLTLIAPHDHKAYSDAQPDARSRPSSLLPVALHVPLPGQERDAMGISFVREAYEEVCLVYGKEDHGGMLGERLKNTLDAYAESKKQQDFARYLHQLNHE